MKKSGISKTSIFLALLVLLLVLALACISSNIMTKYRTTYTVLSRCGNSIAIVNEQNIKDKQMKTIDPRSPIKNGDVVNGYLMIVKSYDSTGVKVLSDDYIAP